MKTENHRGNTLSNTGRRTALLFMMLVFLVGVGVVIFLKFYNKYNEEILYEERLNQMQEVTEQLFTGLEDVVNVQWSNARYQCNYLQENMPVTVDQMLNIMQDQTTMAELSKQQTNLIAIDSQGRYYYPDGKQGLMTDMSYLNGRPEQISYVFNLITGSQAEMLFLYRLNESIAVKNGNQTVQIIYYGIAENMEQLNPYFDCKAYDSNNSTYVTDRKGLKLFTGSNGKDLLKGFNVFSELRTMRYLHDLTFDDTLQTVQKTGLAYSNVILDGKEYYYALYQMDNAEWTLLFLVPSSYVAVNTVQLVNTTIKMVLIFAVFMTIVCAVMIYIVLHMQQRKALKIVNDANTMLEASNKKLELAQAKTTEALHIAEDASKAKTDFLANMSHDIRTPMNAIVGITSLMEHETGLTDKMEIYIQKVQLSSRHLLGLINDILDMSRIESNEVQLNAEEVSLAEQIEQIDSIIRAQANEHEQHFHIHVKEIIHEYLVCDGVRLRQICLNLLSNAVKYTPKGGDIILELTEVPCTVQNHAKFVYTVTDNGYGMSSEFLEHIFEPFTRAENSMTNKVQGTGLGMAITKNIVDLMDGEIHVESKLGKGSRFEVILTLPINRKVDYEIGASRVLLVSDESQLIRNVKAAVSESSIQFFAVSTEEEAARWLTWESTDVILLAGCLQKKTLAETVSLFRRIAKNAVLIFCLDFASEEDVQDLLAESGVDGMVLRPFFLSNLATAIARTQASSVLEDEERTILNGMNFLCAEDNELNAEILKELLNMYGASCTIYSDGEKIVEAFKHVKPDEYDAILMDVQMPNMNGLDATRAIRSGENPVGKTIPIIAMTANAFSEDVQHCIGAGMDAHIAKPLDIAVLEKTLRGFSVGGRLSRKDKKN